MIVVCEFSYNYVLRKESGYPRSWPCTALFIHRARIPGTCGLQVFSIALPQDLTVIGRQRFSHTHVFDMQMAVSHSIETTHLFSLI